VDFGSYFINLETPDVSGVGLTPLLQVCRGLGSGYRNDIIAFLLERGANVHAVNSYGESCLHIAIMGARGPYRLEEEFASLALLVQNGADVHLEDFLGRSVSMVAYQRASKDNWGREFGSYWADLWDSVLATCGYNVYDSRRDHPRTAIYTNDYPREIFMKLWEGRQHLCPYWDDDVLEYGNDTRGYQEGSSPSDSGEENEDVDVEFEDSKNNISEREFLDAQIQGDCCTERYANMGVNETLEATQIVGSHPGVVPNPPYYSSFTVGTSMRQDTEKQDVRETNYTELFLDNPWVENA
jgi:hypothetical protein